MSNGEHNDFTHRIEHLERDARRWRVVALAMGGLLGIVGLVGATTAGPAQVADEVRARRFVLVDESGRARAKLDMEWVNRRGGPGPRLFFFDEEERPDVMLSNLYGLVIADDVTGKGWVDLTPDGLAFEVASDKRIELTYRGLTIQTAGGSPFVLTGLRGDPHLALIGRVPRLTLADGRGQARAVLGHTELETIRTGVVQQRPASSLALFDKDGQVLFKVP